VEDEQDPTRMLQRTAIREAGSGGGRAGIRRAGTVETGASRVGTDTAAEDGLADGEHGSGGGRTSGMEK
jgi:hypothetical protein